MGRLAMHVAVAALAGVPLAGLADGWRVLACEQDIRDALAGRDLLYTDGARQQFGADGTTLYRSPGISEGRWTVRGARYCSQWPPSETWACYDLAIAGAEVRFTGDGGAETVGVVTE